MRRAAVTVQAIHAPAQFAGKIGLRHTFRKVLANAAVGGGDADVWNLLPLVVERHILDLIGPVHVPVNPRPAAGPGYRPANV